MYTYLRAGVAWERGYLILPTHGANIIHRMLLIPHLPMKRSPQLFMIGKKTTFYGDTAVQCVILMCSQCSEVNYTRAAMSVLKEEKSLKTKIHSSTWI